ncbi:MAG: RodZ domain-containing protein [Egibacteraceae bacterium]
MATGIGDVLRAARREQGRTLADAGAETRIRETYLAALEEEDFAAMGGDVYVKGFLRSYARYLGVDPDPLLERFRSEHERPEERTPIAPQPLPPVGPVGPMGPMGPRRGLPQVVVIGGILLGILIVLGLIGLATGNQPPAPGAAAPAPAPAPTTTAGGSSTSSEPPASMVPSGEAAPDPFQTAVPAESASPVERETSGPFTELLVKLTVVGGESYVRSDVGSPRIDGVFQTGYTNTFRGTKTVQLRIGDAAHVELAVNGQALGALGGRGEVVEVTCQVGATACQIRAVR